MTHTVTQDFREEYEAERTRWLRRRIVWYAGMVAAFGLLHLIFQLIRAATGAEGESLFRLATFFTLTELPQVLIYLAVGLHVWRHRTAKQDSLLAVVYWAIVISGIIAVVSAPIVTLIDLRDVMQGAGGFIPDVDWDMRLRSLFTVFFMHFVACLFIPWTAREAARPLIPLVLVLAIVTLAVTSDSLGERLTFIALSPLVGVPGVLVCWWRHSRFRDRFLYRMVRGRYGELQRELIDARVVHEELFPAPITTGPLRFHYRYQPMRQIGGDYLYANTEQREELPDRLNIALIDVTGHGIKAALTVNRVYGELERIFAEAPDTPPGDLLLGLNRYVRLTLAKHDVYATALCLRFDPGVNELEYANAGHPPAFLRTAGGLIERLDSTAPLLGVFERKVYKPDPRTIRFGPGDTLIAYTDGATDTANEAGDRIQIDGLQRILASDRAEPQRKGRWAATIAQEINRFRSGAPIDDTLLVEVWRPIDAPAAPRRERSEMIETGASGGQ